MSNRGKTKLKLLYIKDYLERYSDEDHPVSAQTLQLMLKMRALNVRGSQFTAIFKRLRITDLKFSASERLKRDIISR